VSKDNTFTVTVPPVFWEDCVHFGDFRDDFTVAEIGPNSRRRIQATLTERDLDDLYSRARHYAGHSEYDFGLMASARATVKALEKQVYSCNAVPSDR
jgi:hypothetical protein